MKLVKNDFVEVRRGFQTERFNSISILYRETEHDTNLLEVIYIDTYIESDGYFAHRAYVTLPKQYVENAGMRMDDDVLYLGEINAIKDYVRMWGVRHVHEFESMHELSIYVNKIFQQEVLG